MSEEVFAIGASLGVQWMATDEGVLSRTLGMSFMRDGQGHLPEAAAQKLYTHHRYENGETRKPDLSRSRNFRSYWVRLLGNASKRAASHLMRNIREAAQPALRKGQDAIVSIILDARMRGNTTRNQAANFAPFL